MSHLLLYYQRPEPATWVFLSSFLLLSIYFVFHRFFSVRNLDILLLLLLAPGLMMVYEGRRMELAGQPEINQERLATQDLPSGKLVALQDPAPELQAPASEGESGDVEGSEYTQPEPKPSWNPKTLQFYGFAGVLIACFLLCVRMLIDPALVRRPLLMPNLSIGGLSFIGVSLFLFLMANVITSPPGEQAARGPKLGPGYALLRMLPSFATTPEQAEQADWETIEEETPPWLRNVARAVAILSNLVIVAGIVCIGYWHFDNVKTGIGCAVMYLLLPYTAQMTGNLDHAVPAAFLVSAVLLYRQPLCSGVLLGICAGLVYYPFFLLPLWISFYWKKGLSRLLIGITASLLVMSGLLLLEGFNAFAEHMVSMFGLWTPRMDGLKGIWGANGFAPAYRLPVLVAFIFLSVSFVFWPSRKTLGSLTCGTAAVMLAAQFWHGDGGGLYMAWFLPCALLTIFRPNLDDRVATTVVN